MSIGKKTRRSRHELRLEVLRFCSMPRGKTEILRACNLNNALFNPILREFLEKKMLLCQSGKYLTTEKGREILVLQLNLEERMR